MLAGLAARTAELCAAERIDAAAELDRESTARFAELMACHPDAGERAVAALDGAGSNAHRLVLELVLEAECSRRSRTDALVGEVLAAVLRGGALADTGEFLIDGPWLRAPHEPAVLTIAAAAEAGEVPGAIATGLLRTLWDNIEQDGERPDPVRDDLAMQWLADGNRCQRAVAVRHLLRAGGRRGMVLSWLRRSGSPGLTAEITRQVARDLSPREAVAILRELSSAAPSLAGACMVLAARAPEAVIDGYYECLASDTHPAARRDLIAGLAMAAATDECRAALELANVADSAAEVRVQAMLSLSATAPEQAEAACWRVLAHPETAADPKALAVVVFAVQNLEAAGLVNAVDRLGTRLRSRALSRSSRELLERVLRQGVPPRLPATAPPAGRR